MTIYLSHYIVKKGQLLYQFSTESAQDAVKSAELGVRQAKQSYEDAVDARTQSTDNLSLTSGEEGYVKKLYVAAGDKISVGTKVADIYESLPQDETTPWPARKVDKECAFFCNNLCSYRKICPAIRDYNAQALIADPPKTEADLF